MSKKKISHPVWLRASSSLEKSIQFIGIIQTVHSEVLSQTGGRRNDSTREFAFLQLEFVCLFPKEYLRRFHSLAGLRK